MNPSTIEIVATILFCVGMIHTFSVHKFRQWAGRFPDGSVGENLFHLLGEVEIVFGFWAAGLLLFMTITQGFGKAVSYLSTRDFTEPAFVFTIMAIAATKPVLEFAGWTINGIARLLPMKPEKAFYFTALVLGPLLGSFITEPGAMTVTALILKNRVFDRARDRKFMYLTLGILFVNISVGGVLTPYAAPPVVMVASKFGWGLDFMLVHFGAKSVVIVLINAAIGLFVGKKVFARMEASPAKVKGAGSRVPWWIIACHIFFMVLIVVTAHHMAVFLAFFLFFIGVVSVTREYQDELKIRESLLVGFFLAGLVTLGGMQSWWLEPLLGQLNTVTLYLGSAALTAVTDNAALTYLGSQVPGLSEAMKYSLVSGSIVGGGLTVIANAPNPAGYSILNPAFGKDGISPAGLFVGALVPTIVAVTLFWFLPL